MKRLPPFALLCLVAGFIGIPFASATTYYIAADGSDSNNGTSKSSPWAHAPGMSSATGAAASTTPSAGDSVIFRGGDTWHYGNSSASPYVGSAWRVPSASGTSTHCNYARTDTSTCIYYGVDQTWYSGGSWARPILDGDNAITNGFPSSCTYDEGANGSFFVNIGSVSYITFDNFEFRGKCWSNNTGGGSASWGYLSIGNSTNVMIEHTYMHGWSTTPTSADYMINISDGAGTTADLNQFAYIIIDGSDSSRAVNSSQSATYCRYGQQLGLNSSNLCSSGQGIYAKAYDVHGSIFRYMGNFMVTTNTHTLHDNLFEYVQYTYSGVGGQQHPNVDNMDAQVSGQDIWVYNNVIRHNQITELFYNAVVTNAYWFNNVFYDNLNLPGFGQIANGCVRFNQVSNSNANTFAYIYNNTFGDSTCQINFDHSNSPLTAWNGTGLFENNHYIGYSSTSLSSTYVCDTSATCAITDNGHHVFQTSAVASGQGYTASNNYAPTANNNATVGAGMNVATSCGAFSPDSALCSGTSDAVGEQSADGGEVAAYPAISVVARTSAWDTGAYQFGNGQLAPAPPTGLAALVQ